MCADANQERMVSCVVSCNVWFPVCVCGNMCGVSCLCFACMCSSSLCVSCILFVFPERAWSPFCMYGIPYALCLASCLDVWYPICVYPFCAWCHVGVHDFLHVDHVCGSWQGCGYEEGVSMGLRMI